MWTFYDVLVREKTSFDVLYNKQAFLDSENYRFQKNPHNLHFSKAVIPWFWSKNRNFVNVLFCAKYTKEKYLVTFSLENKPF